MILKKHFAKFKAPAVFATMLFCLFLFSCSNGIQRSKTATVSFYIDDATVQLLLQNSVFRAADDDTTETTTPSDVTPADDTDATDDTDEEEAAAEAATKETLSRYEGYYIDVTLVAETTQTKSQEITKDIKLDFEEIPIGAKVYATAQLYKYTDEEQKSRIMVYRGESDPIYVRERGNILTIKLATAKVTVSFETNGGSAVEAQVIRSGAAAQEPENPVKPADKAPYNRENFAFAGWFSDAELTKPYNFADPVKDDITIYAKWLEDFVLVPGETVQNSIVTGRSVKVADLYVSDHEVTQAEYKAVMGKNPANNKNDKAEKLPVENVSWFDAIIYCNKLSIKEGLNPCYKVGDSTDPDEWGLLTDVTAVVYMSSQNGYRLPTESEWSYIAQKAKRTNTDFTKLAYYAENGDGKTHSVKYKLADELCLCDLLGNVSEWCYDWYASDIQKAGATGPIKGTKRVIKGGSYKSSGTQDSIIALREAASPSEKSDSVGFRLVRTIVYDFKVVKNTVSFDSNGGSSVEEQTVIDGELAQEPKAPEKTGYIFKGWKYDTEDFDFATPVTMDLTLTAKWVPITYKVVFDYNPISGEGSGSVTSCQAEYDKLIELPAASTITPPTGYHFKKWSLAADSENLEYDDANPEIINLTSEQDAVLTLYVIWEENGKHTITYRNIDYPGIDISALKQEFRESEGVNLQDQIPSGTRTGYTFDGWFTSYDIDGNGDGSEIIGWAAGEKTEDIIIYARWTANIYEISYELNGGAWKDGYTAPVEYTYGVALNLPDADKVIKAGYGLHWFTTSTFDDGTEVTEIAAGTTANPFKVWAKWVAGEVNYTVHHMKQNVDDNNYTEVTDDKQTLSGVTGENTAAVAKTYEGFTAKTFNQETIAGTGNTEVTIYYDRNRHTVTYAAGKSVEYGVLVVPSYDPEGVPTTVETYPYGKPVDVNMDARPTLVGYKFDGWIGPDGTIYSETTGWSDFIMGDADVVLTATWVVENQEAGIDVGFGIDTSTISVTEPGENETVFVAATDYSTYSWKVDDTVESTTNTLDMASIATVPGVYDITLTATKTVNGATVTHTWTGQFVKTN